MDNSIFCFENQFWIPWHKWETFCKKKVLGLKKFWVQKVWVKQNFYQKNIFQTQKFLDMKFFLIQNLKKSSFTTFFHFCQGVQNWFSKQKMELFLPLPGLWSKNLFYTLFLICSKGLKIDFQNRKWNYPNRKWNYFSHFQTSDQKTYFKKCFSFVAKDSKLTFKKGNEIIQTGNGTISPNSISLIKKLLLHNVYHLIQWV